MNPRRKQRLIAFTCIFALLCAGISIMIYSLSNNFDAFYTPSEIIQGKDQTGIKPALGQRLRIGGMVVPGSVKRDNETLTLSFDLVDTGPKVTVQFTGILPDLFREGQGIVASGVLEGDTLIVAHEVLAKHDEEYMPPELAEKMKGIKHVPPKEANY